MQNKIKEVCQEVSDFLVAKNKAYGDSASDPVRVFSKVDTMEQLNVRIDDKLSRIARGNEFDGDDTELDLIGYLILKRVIRQKNAVREVDAILAERFKCTAAAIKFRKYATLRPTHPDSDTDE